MFGDLQRNEAYTALKPKNLELTKKLTALEVELATASDALETEVRVCLSVLDLPMAGADDSYLINCAHCMES